MALALLVLLGFMPLAATGLVVHVTATICPKPQDDKVPGRRHWRLEPLPLTLAVCAVACAFALPYSRAHPERFTGLCRGEC